jgi:hypothetical protein
MIGAGFGEWAFAIFHWRIDDSPSSDQHQVWVIEDWERSKGSIFNI